MTKYLEAVYITNKKDGKLLCWSYPQGCLLIVFIAARIILDSSLFLYSFCRKPSGTCGENVRIQYDFIAF